MSRIRFGLRTVRVKTYQLEKFGITKEEAESFAVDYDGFDIWNTNESLTTETPQIEKRVKYFHIMFLPFFAINTHWVLRNKNGVFKINTVCERKVKSIYPKSYAPWYAFLAPILCVAALLVWGTVWSTTEFIGDKIKRNNYATEIINERQRLIKELDSIPVPFYLTSTKSFSPDKFIRVDSIIANSLFVSSLVNEPENFKSDYDYHKAFSTNDLEAKIMSRDSIISLIPKNPDQASYRNRNWKLRRIIPVKNLERPNLDFDFHLKGITIKNLGKPLILIDFQNNSSEKNRWSVQTNKQIGINENLRVTYTPGNNPSDVSNLTFIFSDNENIYEYQVQGTFKQTSSYTAFVQTAVEMK